MIMGIKEELFYVLILFVLILLNFPSVAGEHALSSPSLQTPLSENLSSDMKIISEYEGGVLYTSGKIPVVRLNGSYRQMGRQYGELLKPQLWSFHRKAILENFPSGPFYTKEKIIAFAQSNFQYYPDRIRQMFEGIAETSGLSLDQLILLDQYVTLSTLKYETGCSQIAAWGNYSVHGMLVYGKNEDFFDYFKEFDDSLVITVLNPDDGSASVATIGNAGELSTMNEISSNGLVLAMNSAPSAYMESEELPWNRIPPFLNYLLFFLDSKNFDSLESNIREYKPPFSYILNIADPEKGVSFECTTDTCVKRESFEDLIVSTNHFMDPSWNESKQNTDEEERDSRDRYKNLTVLGQKFKGTIDARVLMQILDIQLQDGGATNPATIFQFVTTPADRVIWVKIPGYQDWTRIDAERLFI